MFIIQNKYKKVANFCYELFRIAKIPLHFSKFSNKIYSTFQKLYLLVYKQFRKFTFEELLTDLADNKSLRAYLGLQRLPHYTTLIKFSLRLPFNILEKLVLAFRKMVPKVKRVSLDSTGISLDNASPHYCKRIGLTFRKRPFMKASFIVDIDHYLILLCKLRKNKRHDTVDAKPMIKKLAKYYSPDIFYADRAYDDNKIFKLVFEELGAYPLILQKRLDVPKHKRQGEYRKLTYDVFDYGEYLQRNKGETGNAMIKRRFGNSSQSGKDRYQKIDIFLRVVAFNIDRLIRLGKDITLILIRIARVSY
jgi:transposase